MRRRNSLKRKRPLTNGNLGLRFERASGDSANVRWYNLANLTNVDVDYGNMVMSAGDWPIFDGAGDKCGAGQGLDGGTLTGLAGAYSNFATNPVCAYTDLGGGLFTTDRCFELAAYSDLSDTIRLAYWNYNIGVFWDSTDGLQLGGFNGAVNWTIAGSKNLSANTWHHLAVNYRITNVAPNGYADLYLDGELVATSQNQTRTISGITAANPGVVTCTTNHDLATGDYVTFSGLSGMPWSALNGQTLQVTKISNTTFSINDTSMMGGNYSGSGTITFNLGIHPIVVVATQRAYYIGTNYYNNNTFEGELDTFRVWTRHLATDEIARNAGIVIGRNG